MDNQKIAKIFKNISLILELQAADRFRILAYERAAEVIKALTREVAVIYKEGGLKALNDIPEIGISIAAKIEELIKTGKLKVYNDLQKDFPAKMLVLREVPGIGPKTAAILYKQLKIDNLTKLSQAAKSGVLLKLPHFKDQTVKNILRGLAQYKIGTKERNRLILTTAGPIADEVLLYLRQNKAVKKCEAVGSLRRMKETIGDIDIIVASLKPQDVINDLAQANFVKQVLAQGKTKISLTHVQGVRIDVEILAEQNYGSLLQHFTGSKEHNVHLRTWASSKGLQISEYGIKDEKSKKDYHFTNEPALYKFLGMQYIEPELREDRGELEGGLAHKLPKLISYTDLQGDLHCHTIKSDGSNTIEELAKKAMSLKYKYLGISDHSSGLGVTSGLSGKGLLTQQAKIYQLNKKNKRLRLLAGAEIEIKANGQLDIEKQVIVKLDYAIGSVHSAFHQDEAVMTKRLLSAISSGIKILGHPSGRLIGQRPAFAVDWIAVFKACAKYKVALEVNSFPQRLDLKDTLIKDALAYGCKLVINSDSHQLAHLDLIKYGIAQARRGWATKGEVINTWPLEKLLAWFKS